MDWIMENAFERRNIDSEADREFLIGMRNQIRDIGDYKLDLYSIGKDYYEQYLEDFDPGHCIRGNFGYEALGQGVIDEGNWIKLPSGAYAWETCFFDCKCCPYGFKSEEGCTDKGEYVLLNDRLGYIM